MPFSNFLGFLCCCRSYERTEESEPYDETTHLIVPETVEPHVSYAEDSLINQRKLRERLTEIVRLTEGKMVNVASQLPFNLHNQVIQKTEYHSRSRSVSESRDRYYDRRDRSCYPALYSNHDMDHFRNQSKYTHGLGRLRPASPHLGFLEGGLSTRTRSPSPIAAEQPTPARLLNIRLIGYTDANVRGRARERGSYPTGLPETKNSSSDRVQGISPVIDQPTVTFDLHLPDPSTMIMTWGD